MRLIMRGLVVAVALALSAGAAHAGGGRCLDDAKGAVTVTGTLTVGRFEHPNGQEVRPFILELAQPVCVAFRTMDDQPTQVDGVTRLQLAGEFDPDRAGRLRNQPVRVTGSFFEAHTAWHITDVLIAVQRLDPAR